MHVDRVAQLQRALSSLQLASDRREQTERKLRLQLENELKMERARNNKTLQISNAAGKRELVDERCLRKVATSRLLTIFVSFDRA